MWLLISAVEAVLLATLKGGVPGTEPFLAGWVVACFVLFGAHVRGAFPTMSRVQMIGHRFGVIAWPLIITTWFSLQGRNIVPTLGWPNRAQHLMFATALVALFLPLLMRWWQPLLRIERIVLAVALVVLIGTGVELLEYGIRMDTDIDHSKAWRDTMIDSVMNMIGAALAATALSSRGPRPNLDLAVAV